MKSDRERITELEFSLAHLQRQCEVLNDVVTEQAKRLERALKRVQGLEARIESLKTDMEGADREGAGDLLDEKPPHY